MLLSSFEELVEISQNEIPAGPKTDRYHFEKKELYTSINSGSKNRYITSTRPDRAAPPEPGPMCPRQ